MTAYYASRNRLPTMKPVLLDDKTHAALKMASLHDPAAGGIGAMATKIIAENPFVKQFLKVKPPKKGAKQ